MLFSNFQWSLFSNREPSRYLELFYSLVPHNVIIYNPIFHNDIKLYFVEVNETELIIKEGFELEQVIKKVPMYQPMDKLLYNTLIAFNEIRGAPCRRTWIIFEATVPTLVVDILRLIPYLNTQVIKGLFGSEIPLMNLPTALCLIKFLELTYNLYQSDITGVVRDIKLDVIGKKSFYEFMGSKLEKMKVRHMFSEVYVNRNHNILFGREVAAKVIEFFNKGGDFNLIKLTELVFELPSNEGKVDNNVFPISKAGDIQVSDNDQLVYYIRNGVLKSKPVSCINRGEIAYGNVGLLDEDTKIATFFQWTTFPVKDTLYKAYCNNIILSTLDKTDNRWELIKKRVDETIFPKKMVSIKGISRESDYCKKRAQKLKEKLKTIGACSFYDAERIFATLMYYNIEEEDPQLFKTHMERLFYPENIEHQVMYTNLLDHNIFCRKELKGEIVKIDIDTYIDYFKKKFRHCRYEGFYALTVMELFNLHDRDINLIIKDLTDNSHEGTKFWCRNTHTRDEEDLFDTAHIWLNYRSSMSIYSFSSERHKTFEKTITNYSKDLLKEYLVLGKLNNQVVLYFKKKDPYPKDLRWDEVFCQDELNIFVFNPKS